MLLPYAVAAGWSWLVSGDVAAFNPFERRAGLREGGYVPKPVRRPFRRGDGKAAR